MQVRAAKFGDIPALAVMLQDAHARSKYAHLTSVDAKAAKGLVFQAVQRHGLSGAGGTCVFVADNAGDISGFIIGTVQPLYLIGDRFEAQDVFFLCRENAPALAALHLIDAYTAWARGIPGVVAIKLSATDILQDWRRVEKLFRRKGYVQAGIVYERAGE